MCPSAPVTQLQLEREAKAAAEKEATSLERSLAAERARTDAARAEAAASAESLEVSSDMM